MRDDVPAISFGVAVGFLVSTIIFIASNRPCPALPTQPQTITIKHEWPEKAK